MEAIREPISAMGQQLRLYVCDHFKDETLAVLASTGFHDVEAVFFSSRCSRPLQANPSFSDLPQLCGKHSANECLCGCSCLSNEDRAFLKHSGIKHRSLNSCFEMIAPSGIVESQLADGAYIVTSGWLRHWQGRVKKWGEQAHLREMFSECVSKLVLFDTGTDPNAAEQLKALAA
jgi:hypothetical protein